MRQAKLRQAGTNLSRSDVVMVMMEEAIVRSREEIETRFRKLEKEQGIDPEEEPSEEVEPEPDDATQGMFSVFGMVRKKANTDVMKVRNCYWMDGIVVFGSHVVHLFWRCDVVTV